MGVEIERKFLVVSHEWRAFAEPGVLVRQGYLCTLPDRTVRIRTAGDDAWLTIKGRTDGLRRAEFEYAIPLADAVAMLAEFCPPPLIEKTRHIVPVGHSRFEVDEFHGDNAGLVIAEIELVQPDQPFERPRWLGREVSAEARYFNSNLLKSPYTRWPAELRGTH